MSILTLDTDLLRSTVQIAETTNDAITEAVNLLNQVVIHNDWECVERDELNNYTLANRQTARDIQDKTASFYNAIKTASAKFDEAERNTIANGNSLDEVISRIANVVPGINQAASSSSGDDISIVNFDQMSQSMKNS